MFQLARSSRWRVGPRPGEWVTAVVVVSLVSIQPVALGDTSHRGVTFSSVVDFDPDRFNPIIVTEGDNYAQDNTATFAEDDFVVPGTDGIKGGSFAEFSTGIREEDNVAVANTLRFLGKAIAQSGVINTQSNSIALGAAARGSAMSTETIIVDTFVSDTFMVAGQAITTFARSGVQNDWGFSMAWETGGSIKVESDLGTPLYEVSFVEPITNPALPTDQTTATTPFFREVTVNQAANFSLDVLAEARIVDGFMTKQGDVANVDAWPQVTGVTHTVVNLIPQNLGQTPNAPIKPEPESAWGQPLIDFLDSAIDFGLNALPASLIRQAIGDPSNNPAPPAQLTTPATGGTLVAAPGMTSDASASASQDDLAIFLYMPTGSYYEVPFPDGNTQTFMTATGELILGIDDFSGLDNPVHVVAEGVDLGPFGNGDNLNFEVQLGHGVGAFDVISAGDAQTAPWVMQLRFDLDTAFLVVAVPEPSSLLALTTVMGLVLSRPRRRA